MTGRMLKVRPYQAFCNCCERDENSDWMEDRERYECRACQRDWESEHQDDELSTSVALIEQAAE